MQRHICETQLVWGGEKVSLNQIDLALLSASEEFRSHGLGIVIFDAYRPHSVSKFMWEVTPEHLKQFVADPEYAVTVLVEFHFRFHLALVFMGSYCEGKVPNIIEDVLLT
jgi:hypothetical protein